MPHHIRLGVVNVCLNEEVCSEREVCPRYQWEIAKEQGEKNFGREKGADKIASF